MGKIVSIYRLLIVYIAFALASAAHFAEHQDALSWRQDSYPSESQRRQLFEDFVLKQEGRSEVPQATGSPEANKLCGHLSAKQTTAAGGFWFNDTQGNLWWEPADCKLRRLSVSQARTCLADRQIFFVGDSVTRFQYLSLADFVSRGSFAHPYGKAEGVPALPLQPEWGTWDKFYQGIPERLAQTATNGTVHATCDCKHGKEVFPQQDPAAHEHHKFHLRPSAPIARELLSADTSVGSSTLLSFLLVLGSRPPQQSPIDGLLQALRGTGQHGRGPDAVIMNHGFWMLPGVSDGQLNITPDLDLQQIYADIFQEAASFKQQQQREQEQGSETALLWKTTTKSTWALDKQWTQISHASTAAATAMPDWGVLDVRALTEAALSQGLSILWDGVHPWPVVYEQFNDLMLNILCDEQLQFGLS